MMVPEMDDPLYLVCPPGAIKNALVNKCFPEEFETPLLECVTNNKAYWLECCTVWLYCFQGGNSTQSVDIKPLDGFNRRWTDDELMGLDPQIEYHVRYFIGEMSVRRFDKIDIVELEVAPLEILPNLKKILTTASEMCRFSKTNDLVLLTLNKVYVPSSVLMVSSETPYEHIAAFHGMNANLLVRKWVEMPVTDFPLQIDWEKDNPQTLIYIIGVFIEMFSCPLDLVAVNNDAARGSFPKVAVLSRTLAACGDNIGVFDGKTLKRPRSDDPHPLVSIIWEMASLVGENFKAALTDNNNLTMSTLFGSDAD